MELRVSKEMEESLVDYFFNTFSDTFLLPETYEILTVKQLIDTYEVSYKQTLGGMTFVGLYIISKSIMRDDKINDIMDV